jgi:cytochrome c oxidase subunit II
MQWIKRLSALTVFLALIVFLCGTSSAWATGAPVPWGLDFQPAASPVKQHIEEFHHFLLIIITAITLFVMGLLAYVIVRFNARANPVPSKNAHNTMIEIIWTVIPVVILIVIAIPSFKLLYYGDKTPNPGMTLKVSGHQWYWSYEYPDHGGIAFDSRPIWDAPTTTTEQAKQLIAESSPNWLVPTAEPLRLLEVDNRIVLPVGVDVRVLVTAADVLHSWAMPALGVKKDAVPGRLNETWLRIDHEGLFYGQCSEICGTGHGFMPIVIEGVSPERFASWVASKRPAAAATPVETTKTP